MEPLAPRFNVNDLQPDPIVNDYPALWPLVMQDMADRHTMGIEKYGVPLQPHNGRDFLMDMYQEALDKLVYCRGLIYERDGK